MLTVDKLAKRLRNWTRFRMTVKELSRLSDRDLHDLGLCRDEIQSVAKKYCRGV
jgi:uncharacterized protein YjiS (DUF1127 family)